MRVLFLNQYFPPDPAPTGLLLVELADALKAAGHTVDFVSARQEYRGSQRARGRLVREAKALGSMLLDGVRRPRADVVFSASSPPCLLVAATLVAKWHRAKSVHWAMDLYPELAVALGEVRAGFLPRLIERAMRWGYRRAVRVVALDEDMAARLRGYGAKPEIIRPWVFEPMLKQLAIARGQPDAVWTWIYSGNLGRAHEWATLLEAQAILEARGAGIRLLFQGGGPARAVAQARAVELELKNCEWRDYAAESDLPAELLRARVLVVTQRPETQGLLWPSKLGMVMSLPRHILWVGPADGAIARMLREFSHAGVFLPGQGREIADWLVDLKAGGERVSAERVLDSGSHRQRSLANWLELFQNL